MCKVLRHQNSDDEWKITIYKHSYSNAVVC